MKMNTKQIFTNKIKTKKKKMKKETLERLLNEACELLIIFEDGNIVNEDDKTRISAIFNEIKYANKIDSEIHFLANKEVQDWDTFGKDKI